jgi:hypothetical protein
LRRTAQRFESSKNLSQSEQAPSISATKDKGVVYRVIAMEVGAWKMSKKQGKNKCTFIITSTLGKENVSVYTLHGSGTMMLLHMKSWISSPPDLLNYKGKLRN